MGRSEGGGVGRGVGGEELVVACADNFWAQLDPERGKRNGVGVGRTWGRGEGFFEVPVVYLCADVKQWRGGG